MKPNECEGCNIYIPELGLCPAANEPVEDIKWCPCRECLVKPMCRLACNEFTNSGIEW